MNIKRFLIVMTFSIVAEALFAKSFSFGVQGDVGINSAIIENSSGNKSDFDFLPAFRFGGGAEFSFNEITSLQLKTLFHHNNGFSFTDSNGKTKVSFMTIDIPILLKLTFTGIENISGRFSLFAGPTFSFRLGNLQESKSGWCQENKTYKFDDIFAAGIECGAEYAFTKEDGFRLGCSVLLDISNFSSDADFSLRRLCVMPYLSYWF